MPIKKSKLAQIPHYSEYKKRKDEEEKKGAAASAAPSGATSSNKPTSTDTGSKKAKIKSEKLNSIPQYKATNRRSYYSAADMEKNRETHHSTISTLEPTIQAKQRELDTMISELERLAGQVNANPGNAQLYNTYKTAYDNYTKLWAEFEPMQAEYNNAVNAYNDEYTGWRSTIRGADEIDAALAELDKQAKTVRRDLHVYKAGAGAGHEMIDDIPVANKIAELTAELDEIERQRAMLMEEKEYGEHFSYADLMEGSDFQEYSAKGAAIENPEVLDGTQPIGNIVTFNRDNENSVAHKFDHMTDDEVAIYNYLLAKEGQESAAEYLRHLDEYLNSRMGKETGEAIRNIDNWVGRVAATGAYGFVSGVDQWAGGVHQLFSNEDLPTSAMQYASQYIQEDLADNRFGSTLYNATTTLGNMAPSILVSTITGGVAGAAGASAKVAGVLGKVAGATTMGGSAAGNAYGQALAEGYNNNQARLYSTLVGLSEGVLQYAIGGIGKLGGVADDVLLAKVAAYESGLKRAVLTAGVKLGSEVVEEELQNFIEPLIASVVFNENYDAPTVEELVETAVVTILTTGMLEGGSIVSAGSNKLRGWDADVAQAIIDEGLAADVNSQAHKLAQALQSKMERGKSVGDSQIDTLYGLNREAVDMTADPDEALAEAAVEAVARENGVEATGMAQERTQAEEGKTPAQTASESSAPARGAMSAAAEASVPYNVLNRQQPVAKTATRAADPGYGEVGTKAFREIVESGTQSVEQVRSQFQTAYELGKLEAPREKIRLEGNVQEIAYNAGRQDAILSMKKAVTRGATIWGKEGGLIQNEYSAKLDARTTDTLQKIGKATGTKIVFDAQVAGGDANGAYRDAEGTIHIAADAVNPVMVVAKHELTHRLQNLAPKEYTQFRNYAVQVMSEGRWDMYGSNTAVEAQQEKYYQLSKGRVNLTTEQAMDEIAADFTERILTDEKALNDFVNHVTKSEEHRTMGQKFFQAVREFIDKVKRIFNGDKAKMDQAAKNEYGTTIEQLEKAEQLWKEAYRAAESRARAESGEVISKRDGKLFRTTESDGTEVLTTANDNPVAMMDDTGGAVFSLKTYDAFGRAELKRWLDLRVSKNQLDKADAADIVRQLDEYYDLCQNFLNKYAPFGAWSNAEVVRDNQGKPVFSVVKANGEYAMNLDFSLVCKKRRTLDAVFGEMIRRGMMDNVDLAEADIAKINDVIRESGFETACALCFVDAKRYRQAKVADAFVNQYNELVMKLLPEDGDVKAHYFDFVETGHYKNKGTGLHTLSNAELRSGIEKLKQVMRDNGSKTVPYKIAKHLLDNPQDRRLVNRGEFMNTDGFGAVRLKNPRVLSLYNSSKGSGGPKAAFSDVQYLGDILKKSNFTPGRAYAVGGVRIQSFSDYIPRLVFDYLQMVADLSAKKLPAHAYTKEAIFVQQFGMTGIKMNMSLVPAVAEDGVAAGLDKNGNYYWFDGQSFGSDVGVKGSGQSGFELAIEIQNAPGYSEHCGTIAVGVSDEHIWKMLDDDDIRMIIPYHKSSLNHIVAVMNNIDKYTDYTGVQNTRFKDSGKKIDKKDFNFNEALRRTGDAKTAADEYLAWCEKNGYLPKFDTFAGHENYYKVLEDFSTYDNGVAAPQGPVTMTFPKEGDVFGSMAELIEQGLDEDAVLEGRRDKSLSSIVDKVEGVLNKRENVQFSMKDRDYMTAVESGDMETAQRMVDEAAKAAGYTVEAWHGTRAKERFTVFRTNERNGNFGSHFTTNNPEGDPDNPANVLGGNGMYHVYLKAQNPFETMDMYADDRYYQACEIDRLAEEVGTPRAEEIRRELRKTYPLDDEEAIYEFRESGDGMTRDDAETERLEGFMRELLEASEYDSLAYQNEMEGTYGEEYDYVILNPNQIKSADPVEYDNNGNVIPLSQRFNSENEDIRYSMKDSAGKELTKEQTEYFKDSKVRDKSGNLLLVYHGSPAKFTKFSHEFIGRTGSAEGRGFYFTDKKSMAEGYQRDGGQVLEGYLNIVKPLSLTKKTMTRAELAKLLKALDPTGDDIASGYDMTGGIGYPSKAWYTRAMNDAVKIIWDGNDNDADILAEIANVNGSNESVMKTAMELFGYDGYIADGKYDGASVYVAFASEQFKNADNLNPTSDPDVRFSLKEQAELMRDNARLKEVNAALKAQFQTTKFAKVDPKALRAAARKILKDYDSNADLDETLSSLDELYTYLANGEDGNTPVWNTAYRMAYETATRVLEDASVLNDDLYQEYAGLRNYLRTTGISLNKAYEEDLQGYENLADFRKRNFGRIKIVNNGLDVNTAYSELASMYPGLISDKAVSHPADQLVHLADVLDSLRPYEENPYSYNMREAATWLANDIMERFFELPQAKPTFADKAQRKLTEQVIKDSKKLEAMRERSKEKIDKILAEYREKVKETRKKEKAAKWEAVEKTKEHYKAKEAKMSESRKAAALRERITRHASELKQKLLRPTDKKHIPQELQGAVAKLLECINQESKYEYVIGEDGRTHRVERGTVADAEPAKRTQAFAELQAVYAQLANELTIDPDLMGDDGLLNDVIKLADKPLATMTSEELQIVWTTLRAVEASVRTANKIHNATRWLTVAEAAEALYEDNGEKKDKVELRGILGKGQKLTGLDMETPETYFHLLGKAGEGLFRAMRNSQDQHIRLMKEVADFTHETLDKVDVRKLENQMHDVTLGGEKVKLSTAQIMELYVLMKRKQAMDHIFVGGILPDVVSAKGLKKITKSSPARGITLGDVSDAVNKLTEEQREIADKLQQYASTTLGKWGNQAAMKVYGYEKFGEANYWPIRVNRQEVKSDIQKDTAVTSLANRSFTKGTKPHANNSLRLGSIFDTFSTHASEMATYTAWLGTLEDINRIRNYTFRDDNGHATDTVKAIIDTVHGTSGNAYLDKLLADVTNGVKGTHGETSYMSGLVGNFKAAAVGANLRVIIQQPTAMLRAADVIGAQYMAVPGNPLKGWEKAKKYAPIAQWKDWGYFDINTGRQMKDVLFDSDTVIDKAKSISMWGAGAMDSVAWGHLWNAVEAETKAKREELKPGTEAFYEAVAARFTEVVDHTQVVDGILQRSQIMRSADGVTKMATSFMGEPTKQYNMMMQAAYDAKVSKGKDRKAAMKKLARTAAVLAISGVANAMAQSIIDAVRDDDKEEEYWEKLLAAFKKNLGSTFNPVSYIPFAKDILSILQGYDVSRMDMESIEKLVSAGQNMIKALSGEGKYTVGGAAINLVAEIARLVGIPVSNLKREITSFAMLAAVETDNYLMQYRMEKWMLSMNGNSSKFMSILYNAYMNDKDAFDIIYADMVENDYFKAEDRTTREVIADRIKPKLMDTLFKLYNDDQAAYKAMYADLIKRDFLSTGVKTNDPKTSTFVSTADAIASAMEARMKKDEGVKSVTDLEQRYYSPDDQIKYDEIMSSVERSGMWSDATEVQKDNLRSDLYSYLAGDSETAQKMVDKIEAAKAYGIDETEYLLYKLALEMYDTPNKNGELGGTPTNEEKATAIFAMGNLSDSEITALWDTEKGYEAYAAGVDMGAYVEYLGTGGSVSLDKMIGAQDYGIDTNTYIDFLDMLDKYDQPTESGKLGSFTQDEATAAIAAIPGLTRSQRAYLWQSVNKGWKDKNNPWK